MERPQFGALKEQIQKLPNKLSQIRGRARLNTMAAGVGILALCASVPAFAQDFFTYRDDGSFPQCSGVSFPDSHILYQDPLDYLPQTPVNPQIRYALETLSQNGINDVTSMDLVTTGTRFRFPVTVTDIRCLPDYVTSPTRGFIQVTENSWIGIPTGGQEDLVEITLPEGVNPILLTRRGRQSRFSNDYEEQQWLYFNLTGDQPIRMVNSDGTFDVTGFGPVALQSKRNDTTLIELVPPTSN